MNKRFLCRTYTLFLCTAVLFAFFLPLAEMHGQTISPLEQVMTTTSLISRPLIFRDLQASIDTELGKQPPGLQIEGMHDAIGNVRNQLLDLIQQPTVKYDSSQGTIHISFRSWNDSIQISSDMMPDSIWPNFKNRISIKLATEFDITLDRMKKSNMKEAFLDAAISLMKNSELAMQENFDTSNEKTRTQKLASIIAQIIVHRAYAYVKSFPEIKALKMNADIMLLCKEINDGTGIICEKIRTELISIFNQAESKLSGTIDEISKRSIAANTGIGINQGKGSFNGGLYLYAVVDQSYQLGFFVNGELSKADSTQPTESLFGFHFRYAKERTQIDFLGAILFGDNKFKAFTFAEIGFGVTTRTKNNLLLVGGAVYAMGQVLGSAQVTAGLILQLVQVGSPSLFVGMQRRGDEYNPIIQISFPIVPSIN